MFVPMAESLKGMAYVEDLDAFENFIMDFYILEESIFEDVEDWYNFFCDGQGSYASLGYDPDILQLIDELDPKLIPESFPAIVMFNFEDYSVIHMMKDEVLFEAVPLEELDIKKIETREEGYSVAFI